VLWNLFLAVIPVVLSMMIFKGIRRDRREGRVRWIVWLPALAVWFLFLPNTCYLVTEWRHFMEPLLKTPGLYYDARSNEDLFSNLILSSIFYAVYSGCGLLCFFLAIYPLDILFKPPWVIRPVFFFLCSLGVYLGLIDRYNSWQILRHMPEIVGSAHTAMGRPFLFTLMCGFAIALWLMYCVFGLTMEGARARYRRLRPA
jgi:uncharacterized membrane protein